MSDFISLLFPAPQPDGSEALEMRRMRLKVTGERNYAETIKGVEGILSTSGYGPNAWGVVAGSDFVSLQSVGSPPERAVPRRVLTKSEFEEEYVPDTPDAIYIYKRDKFGDPRWHRAAASVFYAGLPAADD